MRLVNIAFKDRTQLQNDLRLYQIGLDSKEKYFIQVFGSLGRELSEYLIDTLNQLIPGCEILLASSSHHISDAKVSNDDIILGISCFLHTNITTTHFPSDIPEKEMAEKLSSYITSSTKLLIVFMEYFSVSGEEFLKEIYRIAPNLIVAGGKATASGSRGIRTLVGNTKGIYLNGIVCAVIDSEILNVQNSYSFGWRPIGLSLEVTKSRGNIVYEMDHTPIKEIYKRYFGEDIFDTIEQDGWNFPFVFKDSEGNLIGRVLDAVRDDGGISFIANIPEGSKVSFSFGLLENVKRDLFDENKKCPRRAQAIYMYSCIGRVLFLGLDGINNLLDISSDADGVCGFFTYGEAYHFNKQNAILNLANTRVLLSEDRFDFRPKEDYLEIYQDRDSKVLGAITHLLEVTSKELDAATKSLKSYRDMVDEAIHHNVIDKNLNIIYTNEKMRKVSGYTKEQIIGKSIFNVLNDEMKEYVINEVVPTLQKKGFWSGKINHLKADGSLYYVNAIVKAVFDKDGDISSYIVGEIDRTNEEFNQRKLEEDVKSLQYSDNEKRHLIQQYEEIIDKSQIMFRLDLNRNITYANNTFLELSGFKLEDILGRNIYEFLDDEQKLQFMGIGKALNEKGIYRGIIRHNRFDGAHFYVSSIGIYIRDIDGNPVEIMAVGTDITKIIESQREIESVQKDVIIAMGTICEGKSRETGNHIKRVAKYSKLLARLYGCSEEEQSLIEIASPMHDIGKIGIPDAILNKPGKLTPEEFEVMKTHTTLGAEMLQGSNRVILDAASQIARSHHEWWSGGGYPNNLKGDDIPLFGRITAVVDVFDAIGNDRCYKKAWPLPEAIEHIKSLRGTQFQPELVDLFLEHIDDFLVISEKYKD